MTMITISAYAAEITKSGNIITIDGGIETGDGQKFKDLFDSNVNHIKLRSPGGYKHEGLAIAEIVFDNKHRLVTEAIGHCESMCAVIWIAADKHVYNSNAEIGFHLSYVPDVQYWKDELDLYGFNGVEYRHKQGVLDDVVYYAKYVDNSYTLQSFFQGLKDEGLLGYNMWYPTNTELVRFEGAWTDAPVVKSPLRILYDTPGVTNQVVQDRTTDVFWEEGKAVHKIKLNLKTAQDTLVIRLYDANKNIILSYASDGGKFGGLQWSNTDSGFWTFTVRSDEFAKYYEVELADGSTYFNIITK